MDFLVNAQSVFFQSVTTNVKFLHFFLSSVARSQTKSALCQFLKDDDMHCMSSCRVLKSASSSAKRHVVSIESQLVLSLAKFNLTTFYDISGLHMRGLLHRRIIDVETIQLRTFGRLPQEDPSFDPPRKDLSPLILGMLSSGNSKDVIELFQTALLGLRQKGEDE